MDACAREQAGAVSALPAYAVKGKVEKLVYRGDIDN
jgi:hypothetical protein